MESPSQLPRFLILRSSKRLIVTSVCVAVFVDGFIYGAFVPMLPFILRDHLRIPNEQVQIWSSWFYSAFGAGIVIGAPIFGYLADHMPSRWTPFVAGVFALIAATLMLYLATNIYVMMISRVLQGFSYAAVFTVGLCLMVDTIDRSEIGLYIGYFSSSVNVALFISPVVGGAIYSLGGYAAVFWLLAALIGLDVTLRLSIVEKKYAKKWATDDTNCTHSIGDSLLADGESTNYNYGSSNVVSESHNPASNNSPERDLTSLPETRPNQSTHPNSSDHPPEGLLAGSEIPVSAGGSTWELLKSPRFLAAIYGIFLNYSLIGAFDNLVPIFTNRIFGWNSAQSGLVFICLVSPTLTAPLVGAYSDRFGPRWFATSGLLFGIPPLVLLRLVDQNSTFNIVLFCILLVLIGFALNLVMVPLSAELTYVVEELENTKPGIFGPSGAYGQMFAIYTITLALAIIFGPDAAGYLQNNYGWGVTTISMGIACASGVLPVVLFTGGLITKRSITTGDTS